MSVERLADIFTEIKTIDDRCTKGFVTENEAFVRTEKLLDEAKKLRAKSRYEMIDVSILPDHIKKIAEEMPDVKFVLVAGKRHIAVPRKR